MMSDYPFVWLGANRARKHDLDPAFVLLDQAAQARLPVPNGGILLDDFYRLALATETAVFQQGQIRIPRPDFLQALLFEDVRFPRLTDPLLLRGLREPAINVDPASAQSLAAGITAVWRQNEIERRDLVLYVQKGAQVIGTAVCKPDQSHQILQADQPPQSLPALGRWQRPDSDLAPYLQRLQLLLRGVTRTFAQRSLKLRWQDDGEITWLMWLTPCSP